MMPMQRVLIITGTLKFGGVERLVVDTAKALAGGEWQPTVLNLSGAGELGRELERSGIPCVSLHEPVLRKHVLRNLVRTRAAIRSCRPDIIHTHQFASDFYGGLAAWGTDIPIISHVHNISLETFPQRAVRRFLDRWRINAFVTTTDEKFRELSRRFPTRTFLLYNALDPKNLVAPEPSSRAALRAELSIPPRDRVIGGIGRLSWEKGFDLLITSFAEVLQRTPNATLLIIGNGPEEEALKGLTAYLGIARRVRFTGYRTDMAALLPLLDLAVVSSRLESFSLVALEAMFVGIPLIITDRLSSREIFRPAALVVPLSPEGIADGIVTLLGDRARREELAARGRELVRARFTMDAYLRDLGAIYRHVTAPRRT